MSAKALYIHGYGLFREIFSCQRFEKKMQQKFQKNIK